MLQKAFLATKENGFVLTRESIEFSLPKQLRDIQILTIHTTTTEKFYLLRKIIRIMLKNTCIEVSHNSNHFEWLPVLQNAVKSSNQLLVYAQNDPSNGILGLVNCIRKEVGGEKTRCVFIKDKAPQFDANIDFYKKQLDKGLAINVYENGEWGTYRHLILKPLNAVKAENCFANSAVPGDLSSLMWMKGMVDDDSIRKKADVVKVSSICKNYQKVSSFIFNIISQLVKYFFEYSNFIHANPDAFHYFYRLISKSK